MPWKPQVEGEFPTLGFDVAAWIEDSLIVPDGPFINEAFELSDWQLDFLVRYYRLKPGARAGVKPSGQFFFERGGLIVMPQGTGKGPFSAAVAAAEAAGPVLFDGWDANGRPVGRPWPTAWVEITAVSEDQAMNVWRCLLPMIRDGGAAFDIPDTGETRINLAGNGIMRPVTASSRSRLGGRVTFAVQDETHSWTATNNGRRLADTQRRNLAKMGGRFLETSNAWDPAENSVAQETFEKGSGVYKVMPTCSDGNIRHPKSRAKMLRELYDGSPWTPQDRISAEIDELIGRGETAQAERYYLNRVVPAEDRAVDVAAWDRCATPNHDVPSGALITVGVDGARYRDALAIVATEVATGYQWPLGIWERPPNASDDYEHPLEEADAAVAHAFNTYNVWRLYADPGSHIANIEMLIESWQGAWSHKRVLAWQMSRLRPAAIMVRSYVGAIQAGDVTHSGDPTMRRHIGNARRRPVPAKDDDGRPLWTIAKDTPNSMRSIDAMAAAALSWEARGDAIGKGAQNTSTSAYADRVCKCAYGPQGVRPHLRKPSCAPLPQAASV